MSGKKSTHKRIIKDLDKNLTNTAYVRNCNWTVWLIVFLTVTSFGLFTLSWLTNYFSDAIISNLQLRNGSLSFIWWQRPAVRAVYRVHIFNYTNVNDFESGNAKKLHVKEMGPYIYRETLARVNPEIGEDGTITYQELRSYQWEDGSPDDEMVYVPNIPLFSAMAFSRDMSFLAQVSLTAVLSTIQAKPFIHVPAGQFLWGYDDELFRIAKPVMAWQQNIPYDKFGVLAFKAGLSKDRLTIKSGTDDIKNLGNTVRFNGKKRRNIWHDETCDRIDGSDGSMFPPQLLNDPISTIKVYAKEMCRPIFLQYLNRSQTKGIPTLRYKLAEDVFIANTTHNSCYCQKRSDNTRNSTLLCSPEGLFNNSACNYGAPMLSSLPHFYGGNAALLNYVDGLKPKKELHETFIDLHPRLGVPIGGWSRVQLNLEARKADAVPFMGQIQDGTILPILWIEVGIDQIPKSVMDILYHAYYTINAIEACLQWGSSIGLLLSTISLLTLKKFRIERTN